MTKFPVPSVNINIEDLKKTSFRSKLEYVADHAS